MVDRTAEDMIQDRRIAGLESKLEHLNKSIEALETGLRNVHVRIDRLPGPAAPIAPPVTPSFWTLVLRLLGK